MTLIVKLHQSISNIAPIESISMGSPGDKSTWRVDFMPDATDQQKLDAQAIIDAFSFVDNAFDVAAEAINAKAEAVMIGGVTIASSPIATTLLDMLAIQNIAIAKLLGHAYPAAGLKWKLLDGSRITVSEAVFDASYGDIATHMVLTDRQRDVHLSAIEAIRDDGALTDQQKIDAINAYDFSGGWPPNPVV